MIIKEQEQLSVDELKKQGYTAVKPKDYTPEKYIKKRGGGLTWYKRKGSGGGNTPVPSPATVNLNDYVGTYKVKLGKIHIEKKGDSLNALVKVPNFDKTWDLINVGTDEFKFENNKGTIKFNRSGKSVVSLSFDYSGINFTADKEGGSTPNTSNSAWSCIEKAQEKHEVETKWRVKPGQDSHHMVLDFPSGNKIIFSDDSKLVMYFNDAEHNQLNGTWSCDGDSEYSMNLDNGGTWSSRNNKWIYEGKISSIIKNNLMEGFLEQRVDSVKTLIKKNIVETKNKKDSLMIESKLIQSRLKFVLGDEKFNNLSEDKKVRVGFQLFEEIATLSNQGFMNEESLLDTFKGLFGKDVHSLPETFYMPWIDKVLKTLNMNDSYLKEYLIDQLTKTPTEVWNSFENCEKMTHMIAKALSETLIFHLRMDKDFSGLVGVRNSLEETMREEVFIKKIEDKIGDMICSSFNKYATNASNVLQKLKQ
jgi:hypothetical protein